jgi:copper homeostasis protein
MAITARRGKGRWEDAMTEQVPRRKVLLEVAAGSVEDALAAQAGGADRLELNTALALGGLTPSPGLLMGVRQAVALPLFVMVRPRPGGFAYGEADFGVLERDLDFALAHGADGVVLGVLGEDGTVDGGRCARLVRRAAGRPVVFHRAFDVTPDPFAALEQLIDLGVRRVMTSGQEPTAARGAALIAALLRRAAGRIEVLPAGGINASTAAEVLARTGCDQVHAGLRGRRRDPSTAGRPQLSFGSPPRSEEEYDATDPDAVRRLREVLDAAAG